LLALLGERRSQVFPLRLHGSKRRIQFVPARWHLDSLIEHGQCLTQLLGLIIIRQHLPRLQINFGCVSVLLREFYFFLDLHLIYSLLPFFLVYLLRLQELLLHPCLFRPTVSLTLIATGTLRRQWRRVRRNAVAKRGRYRLLLRE
jgi:hypothetical protein